MNPRKKTNYEARQAARARILQEKRQQREHGSATTKYDPKALKELYR